MGKTIGANRRYVTADGNLGISYKSLCVMFDMVTTGKAPGVSAVIWSDDRTSVTVYWEDGPEVYTLQAKGF